MMVTQVVNLILKMCLMKMVSTHICVYVRTYINVNIRTYICVYLNIKNIIFAYMNVRTQLQLSPGQLVMVILNKMVEILDLQ